MSAASSEYGAPTHHQHHQHHNGGGGTTGAGHGRHRRRTRTSAGERRRSAWADGALTTALGFARGLDAEREHDRLYRATLRAVADGLILGRGRHGVVVALTNEPADPWFSLAVKIVSKVFTPSKGKEPSFHRVVSHTLHVQNEVAAMAKLSAESTFVLPLFCAFQDDTYVYLVMERACCSLKQLIQHADEMEQEQLLTFQEAHPLKFLSFCMLTTAALLHACWTLQRARLIHHDIHPAQLLVTSDGRPRLADLGQCSVIPPDGRKQLLPPLGRRDFCRPARLSPLQGAEVDGYGCGATLWVTWKGCYDGAHKVQREWNRHEQREALQRRLEYLATKAIEAEQLPRWPFAGLVRQHLSSMSASAFAEGVRAMIETLVTACTEEHSPGAWSTFSAEPPFRHLLPFLELAPELAADDAVALEPTNFALPSVRREEEWPPPEGSTLAPVHAHAIAQLRLIDLAQQHSRSRSRAVRHEIPELPITLTPTPCVSMLLHPGRVSTSLSEPLVRIALVSMLVRDQLPSEIAITVRARPWDPHPHHERESGGAAPAAADAQHAAGVSDGGQVVLSFSIFRDEFAQEGPSGPVEAKRVLLLTALPLQRARLTFDVELRAAEQLSLCATPPLLLEHRPPPPGGEAGLIREGSEHH